MKLSAITVVKMSTRQIRTVDIRYVMILVFTKMSGLINLICYAIGGIGRRFHPPVIVIGIRPGKMDFSEWHGYMWPEV